MKTLITIGLILLLTIPVLAQTYEKASDTALKVTQSVSTVMEVTKIKERIVDLNDYITLAQAQVIKYQQEIVELQKLLTEADKVGIDTSKIGVVAEVIEP